MKFFYSFIGISKVFVIKFSKYKFWYVILLSNLQISIIPTGMPFILYYHSLSFYDYD